MSIADFTLWDFNQKGAQNWKTRLPLLVQALWAGVLPTCQRGMDIAC